MRGFSNFLFIVAIVAGAVLVARPASAAGLPADLCSLLPAGAASNVLGVAYAAPKESVAPRPFVNTNTGTDCHYAQQGGGGELWFRAYVDPSAPAATDLFARLRVFYSPPITVPHLGDEAYLDPQHALHVRKGKVRFYINLSPADPAKETALAKLVVGKL